MNCGFLARLKNWFFEKIAVFFHFLHQAESEPYPDGDAVYKFLKSNRTAGGMPLSYKVVPKDYWDQIGHPPNEIDAIIERLLTKNSVNIYDGACGQIAEMILGHTELADDFTHRLLIGKSGELNSIRAENPQHFVYNCTNIGTGSNQLNPDNTWFFRMISDKYLQEDPLDGKDSFPGFPTWDKLHHADWKPIAGEQAWGAIIGPLQVAYKKYNADVPLKCDEVRLALSILPAIEYMQSPIGGIYHAPEGTHGKNPADISNENNISMFAALKMLEGILGSEGNRNEAGNKIRIIQKILYGKGSNHQGIEGYFKDYTFNREESIFHQGGFYKNNHFEYTEILAVDVQTWVIIVLGPSRVDEWFGDGASFKIWQATKERGGYYDMQGVLRGVGYSDQPENEEKVNSAEWSFGAIMMTQALERYYKGKGRNDWAKEAGQDAKKMLSGMERMKIELAGGMLAYKYANRRYDIPFDWWANPLPSLASTAWAVMAHKGFNPFVLGGGKYKSRY